MTRPSNSYGDRETALREYVHTRIAPLQERYRRRESDALAAMAKLRRGVGGTPGAVPELWELTLAELPEELATRQSMTRDERDGAATVWERAAYDAITLHALHQQSRGERMHRAGPSIGAAARRLGDEAGAGDAVRRRFHALGTAGDHEARLIHLRGLITQLRSFDIPLDYSRLAVDLRRLDDGALADRVLLAWGRDYHDKSGKKASVNGEASADGQVPQTGDQQ